MERATLSSRAEYALFSSFAFYYELTHSVTQTRPRSKSRKILAILVAIIAFAGTIGVLAASGYSVPSFSSKGGTRHITMDHVFNGTFNAYSKQVDWVKEGKHRTNGDT